MKSLSAPTKVRTCPAACVVEYYLTSHPYISCQTDNLRLFSDSPAWDMLWKLSINYFRRSRRGEDKKRFIQTSAFRVRDRLSWLLLKSLGKLHQRSELSYLKIHTTMNFAFINFVLNGIAVLDRTLHVYAYGVLRHSIILGIVRRLRVYQTQRLRKWISFCIRFATQLHPLEGANLSM